MTPSALNLLSLSLSLSLSLCVSLLFSPLSPPFSFSLSHSFFLSLSNLFYFSLSPSLSSLPAFLIVYVYLLVSPLPQTGYRPIFCLSLCLSLFLSAKTNFFFYPPYLKRISLLTVVCRLSSSPCPYTSMLFCMSRAITGTTDTNMIIRAWFRRPRFVDRLAHLDKHTVKNIIRINNEQF